MEDPIHILQEIAGFLQLLGSLFQFRKISRNFCRLGGSLGDPSQQPFAFLVPGKDATKQLQRLRYLFAVADHFPLGFQFLLLPHPDVGPFDLVDLVVEQVGQTSLLPFIRL